MWPVGHAAVGFLFYVSWRHQTRTPVSDVSVWVLLFGSQLPDLIDKPIAMHTSIFPVGRAFGHSLLGLLPLILLGFVVVRRIDERKTPLVMALGIGTISHTLVDILLLMPVEGVSVFAYLLWPFVSIESSSTSMTFVERYYQWVGSPQFAVEMLLASLSVIVWHRSGYPGISFLGRMAPSTGD